MPFPPAGMPARSKALSDTDRALYGKIIVEKEITLE